jgi:hypothetical protein
MSDGRENLPPTDGHGLERIAQHGRVEFRMVKDDQVLTDDVRRQVIEDVNAYRDDHGASNQPLAWGRLSELIGIAQGTLVDVVRNKYKGDTDAVLRKIDQFLADDRARAGRFDFRTHARIGLTEAIFGAIRSAVRMNSMAVIIGESGDGKSVHARAFQLDRGGVVLIRPDQAHVTDRGVTRLLCNAIDGLRPQYNTSHARRVMAIKDWLRKHGTAVIVVDEAQKLSREGLEMLRDIHDISDPTGRRNVPIVFFGDHDFKKLIFRGRAGARSPISPQTARRMRPVLDLEFDCVVDDRGGIYSAEDIVKIVRNNRVKLLTSQAVRWLRNLANTAGWGRLGMAMGVLQQAIDTAVSPGAELADAIDVPALREALDMTFGRSIALEIDEAAGGELLGKAIG